MPVDKGVSIFMICADCPAPTPKTPISRDIAATDPSEKITPTVYIPSKKAPEPQPLIPYIAHFSFGTAQISARDKQALLHLLPKFEHQRIVLTGYTDSTGPGDFNEWLALRRAQSLKDYLVAIGLDGDAMEAKGQGPCCYLESNDTELGRAANRRVEIRSSPVSLATFQPNQPPLNQPKGETP